MQLEISRPGDIRIATQTFGEKRNPSVLLVMGAMASMLWWPDDFCQALAEKGLHVVRYDNRDTGLSTKYPPGKPTYAFGDMVDDAVAVLDGHEVGKAHVVGMSMGGMLAQMLALRYPARIASLSTISTSPVGIDTSKLPGMTAAYQAHSATGGDVDWSNRAQVIEFMIEDSRMLASTAHPFDAARLRGFVSRDYDRAGGLASATNHFMLVDGTANESIRDLSAPLLVIHGTADPIFPVEHGKALASAVPGSRLVEVSGGGHELHREDWPIMIDAIAEHVRTAVEA
ncbi:alpha/beta fold hydrolase [Mesorhizobium sp. NPDC059054]|uniref:alpha/beta fold hydrolase n=1 Tax=Mesorhizobium sp. NPDC059054 TaxID=3346711 RepID=UPI0036A5E3E9